jgi:hypothetical protein
MPYKSEAQRKFFHTDTAKKAGITASEVKEYDEASKGKKLPEKKKNPIKKAHDDYEEHLKKKL